MPEFRFFHPTEVRYGDLDPQGHVNHARILTYFEQARLRYWLELGLFPVAQSWTELGVIIADVHIRYELPVRWGTPLRVGVLTRTIGNKSFTMDECLADAASERVFARAQVVLVAYDYVKGCSLRVPDAWRDRLQAHEGRPLT